MVKSKLHKLFLPLSFLSSVTFTAFYILSGIKFYFTGDLQNFDFGILYQAASLFGHGKPLLLSVRGVHVFADNQDYIQLLWAPLTYVTNPQAWSLGLHSLLIALPGTMILLMLRKNAPWLGLLLAWCYWLHPAMLNMNQEVLHSEAFAMPLLLGMFWAFLEKKSVAFFVCMVLACTIKEDMPLNCLFLSGCFLLLSWKDHPQVRKIYAAAMFFCAGFFIVNFFLVNPHFRQVTCAWLRMADVQTNRLSPVAPSANGLFTAKNPIIYILESWFRAEFAKYLLILFVPIFLLPKKQWFLTLALIPFLSIIAATRSSYHQSMFYHYDYATIIIVLMCWLWASRAKPVIAFFHLRAVVFLAFVISLSAFSAIELRTPFSHFKSAQFWDFSKVTSVKFLEELDSFLPEQTSISADYNSLNYLLGKGRDSVYMWKNPFQLDYFGIYGSCENNPVQDVDIIVLNKGVTKARDLLLIPRDRYIFLPGAHFSEYYIYVQKDLSPEMTNFIYKLVKKYYPGPS